MRSPRLRLRLALLAAAFLTALAPASAEAARGLALGFTEQRLTMDPAASGPWLQRAVDSGADIVRLNIGWVAPDAPTRPEGFDARNPADPAYDFTRADAAVVDATARGLRVLLTFERAPRWAEGPDRPASAPPGTWRPDTQALEDYGAALALRYSGTFPDPARLGQALPRVGAFQVWNEPNLDTYLTPQWVDGQTFAPAYYRGMLNAFYRGVKSVSPAALVVTAGTGPFGDPSAVPGHRIMPVRFVRDMLCLRESAEGLVGTGCPDPASFDVLAHHPYSVGAPRVIAMNGDDVSIPDLGKLTRLLRAAEDSGGALPAKRHRLWITEVAYDSNPPDPDGVPATRHARWLQEALYVLWRAGADTITWFQIGDQLPQPDYPSTSQAGVYLADGRPKPAQRAFRFPLVAERVGYRSLNVWGRSPLAGKLVVERMRGGRWQKVRRVAVRRHGTFLLRVPRAATPDRLRARVGTERSLVWSG